MLWFWTRDNEKLTVETRFDNETSDYVVTIRRADDPMRTERFGTVAAFSARLAALERQLEEERWTSSSPPQLLPDGFPRARKDQTH